MLALDWRSLLFVPANNPKLLEGAHKRGADLLILDLEDSVPDADKPTARAQLPRHIERLSGQGMALAVRVNTEACEHDADLQASIRPGVVALMVPKVEAVEQLECLDELMRVQERHLGLTEGAIGIVALIESPGALFRLESIAAYPRVIALALGSEDLALTMGVVPTPACLTLPCQWLALAAIAHGKKAYGLPVSLADFAQLQVLEQGATQARAMGLHGALCIHPAQVAVINQAFAPSGPELAWAMAVDVAWRDAEARGLGAAQLDGAMLDKPVVERARRLLAQTRLAGINT